MKTRKNLFEKKGTFVSLSSRLKKIIAFSFVQLTLLVKYGSVCFADANYAERGGKWLLDQLFWVAIVVVIFIFIKNLIARNTVASVTTFIVGGLICFFIKSPETIGEIGNTIASVIVK